MSENQVDTSRLYQGQRLYCNTAIKQYDTNLVYTIQHKKYNTKSKTRKYNTTNITQKYTTQKYNTHVQRQVELSSPELSMMEKGSKQKSVHIWPITFQNYDPINSHPKNTVKFQLYYNPRPHYIVLYVKFQKQTRQLHLTCWYA